MYKCYDIRIFRPDIEASEYWGIWILNHLDIEASGYWGIPIWRHPVIEAFRYQGIWILRHLDIEPSIYQSIKFQDSICGTPEISILLYSIIFHRALFFVKFYVLKHFIVNALLEWKWHFVIKNMYSNIFRILKHQKHCFTYPNSGYWSKLDNRSSLSLSLFSLYIYI